MRTTTKMGLSTFGGGLALILVGVAVLLFQVGIEGMLLALPIALICLGGISVIMALIILVGRLFARRGTAFAKEIADGDKEIDILEGDERNINISWRTSYSLSRYTGWLDLALLIFLVVMQVELVVTLVFMAAIVVKVIVRVLLHFKYNREM